MITVDGVEVWLAPPDGSHVNFTNPQRDIATVTASYCAFGIALTVPVILGPSLYATHYIRGKWHIQHYTIILASILTLASGILTFICLDKGVLGVHVWEMSMDDAIWEKKLILASILLGILGAALARLGLCIIYGKIADALWHRRVIRGAVVPIIVPSIAVWFGLLFACRPVEAIWNLRISTEAHCINSYPFHILHAIVVCLVDLIFIFLTIDITLRLQMPWKTKVVLVGVFSTGLLTLGATVARLAILITGLKKPDTTFALAQITVCLIFEVSFAIICGSLPDFRKFIERFILDVSEISQPIMDRGSGGLALHTIGGTPMNGGPPPSETGYHGSTEVLIAA
ncbi:integral membrane protein [Fusarium mundagurra]|uniref:Integral membrane protein n=1 Tax=Fusarium mundagurra TaxID=1567541 RepID=A0A8H6D619_9HYPO|nr:integral membrane protein [Fusarium mundagurra]